MDVLRFVPFIISIITIEYGYYRYADLQNVFPDMKSYITLIKR